jgi:hypothetical protein
MGVSEKFRTGVNFVKFRTNDVTTANFAKCGIDDDDMVF